MGTKAKKHLELYWVAALQNNNREVFEQIFHEHHCNLVMYADAARDIVQDVFGYLWEKCAQIAIDRSLSSYLFRSVRNASLNYLKKESHKEDYIKNFLLTINNSGTGTATADNALELTVHNEVADKIETVIASLPEQCRNIFRMSRFRGMKNKEIAEIYSMSVRTVETQIYRALKVLKVHLKPHLAYFAVMLWGLLGKFFRVENQHLNPAADAFAVIHNLSKKIVSKKSCTVALLMLRSFQWN